MRKIKQFLNFEKMATSSKFPYPKSRKKQQPNVNFSKLNLKKINNSYLHI